MKIAFLVGTFPSLSETFILNQITGLIEAGHQVDIYAFRRPIAGKVQPEVRTYNLLDRTTYFDIPVSRPERVWKAIYQAVVNIPKNPFEVLRAMDVRKYGRGYSINMLYMLKPFLNNSPYDILHCHFGTVGRAGALLKQVGVNGKLVVTFHGQDISQVPAQEGEAVYQNLFAQVDLIMPVSSYWEQKLIQMGANPDLIQVHRMGIDPRQFAYKPRAKDASDEVRILTVGRLVEKKGIAFALEAVAMLHRRHPDWKIRYQIIGEGPQHNAIKHLVSELGLQKLVHLFGPATQDEVHRQMMDAHLFLLPSITDKSGDQEGIPVSLMEAMASGLPILSTLHTGIPELVEDGISGFLVAERDTQALAERLEVLIQHPGLWPVMGSRGCARVTELHDIRKLNHQLLDAYEALVSKQNGGLQSLTDLKNFDLPVASTSTTQSKEE